MKIEKKVISNLTKCYSIAPLIYNGTHHFLVAAEKQDACLLFDLDGKLEDTIWEKPGGVMTMVQIPGTNGQFLATQKFYSPNDSKEAEIVIVTPKEHGIWEVRTLIELPHVHRFDIIQRNNRNYLIACTLKSGHEYKEDWSMPGKVYVAELPQNLNDFHKENQLELNVIKDQMLRNHGYYKVLEGGVQTAVISSAAGVFQVTPPELSEGEWMVKQLLDVSTSDATMIDLDGDGEKELVTLAPFHGADVCIYKKVEGNYKKIYAFAEPMEFTHAIYGGDLCGVPTVVVGHRQGKRNLVAATYNKETKEFEEQIIDEGCGPANVFHYMHGGKDILIATNREVDEVAMYTIEK